METLFDDIPDPEPPDKPEYPPDTGLWSAAVFAAAAKAVEPSYLAMKAQGWKDLLTEPPTFPPPIQLKLPLTTVAHGGPYAEAELTFEHDGWPASARVVITGAQWEKLGKPQALTVQILG